MAAHNDTGDVTLAHNDSSVTAASTREANLCGH